MIGIIPFWPRHIKEIIPDATEQQLQIAELAKQIGKAYTMTLCGDPIASAGIFKLQMGIGEVWSHLTPLAKRFPLSLHRAVKSVIPKLMAELELRRVQAIVDPNDPAAISWIEHLGFEREGLMKKYTEDNKDMFLYARIAELNKE